MYAIVETGGKQYRVSPGQTIKTELLPASPGDKVELERVLLLCDEQGVTVGNPTVAGAKVLASASAQGRSKKVIVFKYKAKTRYRKKGGHRQGFTTLTIENIVAPAPAAEGGEK
ncbi:MAG: 50S ribosomal protein L21 [Chloroflexi bacterium]|nr:50S ribosomal protein L21 [Chloroflexota bacterium]